MGGKHNYKRRDRGTRGGSGVEERGGDSNRTILPAPAKWWGASATNNVADEQSNSIRFVPTKRSTPPGLGLLITYPPSCCALSGREGGFPQ